MHGLPTPVIVGLRLLLVGAHGLGTAAVIACRLRPPDGLRPTYRAGSVVTHRLWAANGLRTTDRLRAVLVHGLWT